VLRRFFELDATRTPLLLVFEDLHWASHDELEVVHYLITSMRDVPVLLVCVSRNDLVSQRPDWFEAGREHTKIELAPLDDDASGTLIRALTADLGQLADELVDVLVDMSQGSPYLIEQAVRNAFSSETLEVNGAGEWDLTQSQTGHRRIPLTVEDAVSSRVAALAPAERELLEMAASMGAVFWLGALVALGRIDKQAPELWGGREDLAAHYRSMLELLSERDYVLRLPDSLVSGEIEYAFKHNLEREALQNIAPPTRLRDHRLVVAEWLEFRFGERAEEHCEILAQLFRQGGARRKAAEYFILAGDKARARYANYQAAEHYEKGLELLGEQDAVSRIETLHHFGDVLHLTARNGEALVAFKKMQELAFRFDLKSKGGAAHNRIGRLYRETGQLDNAMRHLGTGHALFDSVGDQPGIAASFDDVGKVHWMRGDYDSAERFLLKGLEIRKKLSHDQSIALSYNNLGLVYQDSGHFDRALEAMERAIEIRRRIEDTPGLAQSLNNLGSLYQERGDHARANELWANALEMAKEVGDRTRQAVIYTNLGESYYRLGRHEQAIAMLKQAAELCTSLGDRLLEADVLRGLSQAHFLSGNYSEAEAHIVQAMNIFERAQNKAFLAMALRSAAEIFGRSVESRRDVPQARSYFERALILYQELGHQGEYEHTAESYADFLEAVARDVRAAEEVRFRLKTASRADENKNAPVAPPP